MNDKKIIYIPAGVTSSLFASLLPSLFSYTLYATIRTDTDPQKIIELTKHDVLFTPRENSLKPDRILWFSTHDDVPYLTSQFPNTPILAINSGAILDIVMGRQDERTANEYQKSKLALYRADNICNIIPGFFIQDVKDPEWASKGLHADTTTKLFLEQGNDKSEWWGKAYSVTPKSYIVRVILAWLASPESFPKASIVCSDRQYRRFELREKAGLSYEGDRFLPILNEPIYKDFPHPPGFTLSETNVEEACEKARRLFYSK